MLEKTNLYDELNLKNYFWGGAVKMSININSDFDAITQLDDICNLEGLLSLGEDWNEIDYSEFKSFLVSAFQYNLGFQNHEQMPYSKAEYFFNIITQDFNIENSKCYTNWFSNPWKSVSGGSFNSISEHTIDLALSILDCNKLLLIYFLFED